MYGDSLAIGDNYHEVFEEGVPIPIDILKDRSKLSWMPVIRSYHRYNLDIPGNVEDVNPMKFEANLKPIEEFRYTPISPIPEKDINEHKKKITEYKRNKEFFEVDKKKIIFYIYAGLFGLLIYQVILYFSRKSEKINYEVEKKRYRRYRFRDDDDFYWLCFN